MFTNEQSRPKDVTNSLILDPIFAIYTNIEFKHNWSRNGISRRVDSTSLTLNNNDIFIHNRFIHTNSLLRSIGIYLTHGLFSIKEF